MPTPNLKTDLKQNWVSNETVMPVNVNDWSSRINDLNNIIPVYASTGSYYTATLSEDTYNVQPIVFTDDTINVCPSHYIEGMSVIFEIPSSNPSNCKINVNGLGAKYIRNSNNVNLSAGVFRQDDYAKLRYNSQYDCFHVEGTSYANVDLNNLSATGELRFSNINNEIISLKNRAYRIGEPIFRVDNYIDDTCEVRLEGGNKVISSYPELYAVYRTTYNTSTTPSDQFGLPNFLNRSLWGDSGLGYMASGLPNVTGYACMWDVLESPKTAGCFGTTGSGRPNTGGGGSGNRKYMSFDANAGAKNWNDNAKGIFGATTYVRPQSIKVRVVTRYR